MENLLYGFCGILLTIIGVFLKNVLDDVRAALNVGNRQQTLLELLKQDVDNHKATVDVQIKQLKERLDEMGQEYDELCERLEELERQRIGQLPGALNVV